MFKFICKTVHKLNSLALETQKPFTKKAYQEYRINRCGFAPKRTVFYANYANQESFTVDYLINTCGFAPKRALFAAKYANLAVENGELVSEKANQESFTVNYLVNRCGFAPEKAISATKYVNFHKPDKPDAVISFLKKQGFTETQVLNLVKTYPPLVLCDPEKTLLPKIEFFESKGFSKAHLAVIFAAEPHIFTSSLDRKIKQSFNFYLNLLGSVKDAITAIRRRPMILIRRSFVARNIEILREAGVPEVRIAYMLKWKTHIFLRSSSGFKELVDKVEQMAFDPLMSSFVVGVLVIGSLTRLSWQKKIEVYKRWGFSEDDVLTAFKYYPWCMAISEKKIVGIMEFLVNKMGWDSSILMKSPTIFSLSLNRRIIPRCSVYEVLHSKGLIKGSHSLHSILGIPERLFLKQFVNYYEKEAPELLSIYQEKLECST